ncbi:MAG: alanine racemase [Rhodothermales bacterium]|nr:alanine racemase [Rhodothermales bacterium]
MTATDRLPVNTVAVIDLGALRHNARMLIDRGRGLELTGVVKADAYGHGAVPVAGILIDAGIRRLAVATVAEGVALRDAGIDRPILVFAPPLDAHGRLYADFDLEAVVDSAQTADRLEAAGASVGCHVEIDTGMTRIGVHPERAVALIRRIENSAHLRLAGVMTHLADAETPASTVTERQFGALERILRELGGADGLDAPVHVANSAALFPDAATAGRLAAAGVSGARTGIGLYGLLRVPDGHPMTRDVAALRPVMELRTRVLAVRTVDAGAGVSYGGTWTASEPRRIATLGAGYADGYPRLCSNRAVVGLPAHETTAPVVGSVCMDMTMIDLGPPDGALSGVEPGESAVLFGSATPSCNDVAGWAETIAYEITCGVSARVPRRYAEPGGG